MAYWLFKAEKKSKKKMKTAVDYQPKIYLDELNMYKRSKNKIAINNYFKNHEQKMQKMGNKKVLKLLNNQLTY